MYHPIRSASIAVVLAVAAGCGGGDEREVMKPEETVVGDLVTAPGRAEDRTQAAMQAHREALQQQIEASEGGGQGERE
jgi:hypothetical protein